MRCTSCGRVGNLKLCSHYNRCCIHAVNGRRVEETVSIPLLFCSGCGASHAVLPDVLIPFGSYSVRFVLTVLHAFASRRCTVTDFCDQWQLSQSTVYEWRRRLDLQLSEWVAACRSLLRFVQDCLSSVSQRLPTYELIPGFPALFHQSFHRAFLQGCLRASALVIAEPYA